MESHEAMQLIAEAEEKAKKAKAEALQRAQSDIAEAEKKAAELYSAGVRRAEEELGHLMHATDQKAAENAREAASASLSKQAAISAKADLRLDKAAKLVVERIVNG